MAEKVKIGDRAPVFKLPSDGGDEISLKSLMGKKVVLYFYPKDNTPGCTVQACNLRDNFDLLTKNNFIDLIKSFHNIQNSANYYT